MSGEGMIKRRIYGEVKQRGNILGGTASARDLGVGPNEILGVGSGAHIYLSRARSSTQVWALCSKTRALREADVA